MAKGQIWETRPLEFWDKAKELRAGWQKSIESVEKVVGQGNWGYGPAFPAITVIEDNPVGSMMANKDEPFSRKARLACEVRGWGREICGYQNNCWGAQFLGYIEDGTPWPRRKFVVPIPSMCDQHAKRGAQAKDFENMPQWMADKVIYFGPFDEERNEALNEHKAYCNLRILNDMERIFGQPCDDEVLAQLLIDSSVIRDYSREISLLVARTKPAPLSVKDLYSVFTIGGLTKVDPEATVAFWKSVRDEVQWRADNQIAAVGNERFRWIEAYPPSWHYLKYYRYMETYGAVCVGSQYTHGSLDGLYVNPDGTIGQNEHLSFPSDVPVETREDAVRLGNGYDARRPFNMGVNAYIFRDSIVQFAELMQADGALLPAWRSGVGCNLVPKEQAMYLKEAGLSVMHYEGSQPGDRTDLDEKRLLDQLDAWMQSLGFRRLEES